MGVLAYYLADLPACLPRIPSGAGTPPLTIGRCYSGDTPNRLCVHSLRFCGFLPRWYFLASFA